MLSIQLELKKNSSHSLSHPEVFWTFFSKRHYTTCAVHPNTELQIKNLPIYLKCYMNKVRFWSQRIILKWLFWSHFVQSFVFRKEIQSKALNSLENPVHCWLIKISKTIMHSISLAVLQTRLDDIHHRGLSGNSSEHLNEFFVLLVFNENEWETCKFAQTSLELLLLFSRQHCRNWTEHQDWCEN